MCNGCDRGLCAKGVGRQNRQLNTYDWLADVPGNAESTDLVEVQFKNTRKGYYHNVNNLDLKKGDIVAVEANPGHDIGVVTLTGRLVKLQIKKANLKSQDDIKRIYRIAKQVDLDKCKEAKSREHGTMIQSRQMKHIIFFHFNDCTQQSLFGSTGGNCQILTAHVYCHVDILVQIVFAVHARNDT